MAKRLFDVAGSLAGLVLLSPVFAVVAFVVWRQDGRSPLYIATRAARGGGSFRMVKIRSMVTGADRSGVESTGADDWRITPVGHFIRRWKIDELAQLWNVLRGEMSLVGPRPNTLACVGDYTPEERRLLDVRPGITDFASIVFSDEGDIIAGCPDPDAAYDRLIRPWKSELGLLYGRHAGVWLDLRLIALTLLAIVDKRAALAALQPILRRCDASARIREVARRDRDIAAFAC